MKHLVVYDTSYGNTARIAAAVAQGLGGDAAAIEVETLHAEHLADVELLVVGSPTQSGKPTPSLQQWIESLPRRSIRAAAFDTRLGGTDTGWLKRLALDLVGYAAPRIAHGLAARGCILIDEPMGFIVSAGDGPLQDGELARATAWGATMLAQMQAAARAATVR